MKNIDLLHSTGFESSSNIRFNTKSEFAQFKLEIEKIKKPHNRALFCQQAIQKAYYVYNDVSRFLDDDEFHNGLVNHKKSYFQYSMKIQTKVCDLCFDLIKFYQEEIKSTVNNFSIETQQLLLNSLMVYRTIFNHEKIEEFNIAIN